MCDDCCKPFRGWCKSFTITEILLTLLEALFLVLLIAFISFLILHCIACQPNSRGINEVPITIFKESVESKPDVVTRLYGEEHNIIADAGQKCTWEPSHKTRAVTHYYLITSNVRRTTLTFKNIEKDNEKKEFHFNDVLSFENPDGDEADNITNGFVVALVKIKPSADIVFGCVLSIISEYWTITAASCIESIEEMDSLDNFVMMEGYGDESKHRAHSVADIMIHPKYKGANTSYYDLCALKSHDKLTGNGKASLKLPTPLDYFITTTGDGLTILGFGNYRSVDPDPLARGVRDVSVHVLPWQRCGRNGTWTGRHVEEGTVMGAGRTPSNYMQGVCAGTVGAVAKGRCRYCAGTPLLRERTLLALMADWRHCARDCGSASYVNLALLVPWLRSLDNST